MLKKHLIAIIVTSVLAIGVVVYMYSKNYIVFESGLHIVIPSKPNRTEKLVEREFQPANVQPRVVDTNLVSRVETVLPKSENTKVVEQPRVFDDVMKAAETFMPLITIVIPIYLHTKSKKKRKADDE